MDAADDTAATAVNNQGTVHADNTHTNDVRASMHAVLAELMPRKALAHDNGTVELREDANNGGAVYQTWNVRNIFPCED